MNNYFFIDGSALTAQIRQLRRAKPEFLHKRLCPAEFLNYLMMVLEELHGGSYKRATLYFPRGDETEIEEYLRIPDRRKSGVVRDLNFKFCGHKLKKSVEFAKFVEEAVPPQFMNRFSKSEKGIDIEICCDALRLASASKLDRLFLLTNDSDFVPLCKTLKEFGTNISIFHLSNATNPNIELLNEADSYDVVPEASLDQMFFDLPTGNSGVDVMAKGNGIDHPGMKTEKPDADPSDLLTDSSNMEENIKE